MGAKRMVVRPELELGGEIEVEEDEGGEGGRGVSPRHRLERVVDLVPVPGADRAVVHHLAEAVADVARCDKGLADVVEVRAQAADEPFDEDLEDGGGDEGM
ncbi:hypothetical protein LTR66_007755 [Elasticomyces elasticus]|nr:hypothetical protein LTR66_007755 [Elasticomyces elasticus]